MDKKKVLLIGGLAGIIGRYEPDDDGVIDLAKHIDTRTLEEKLADLQGENSDKDQPK